MPFYAADVADAVAEERRKDIAAVFLRRDAADAITTTARLPPMLTRRRAPR